MQKNPTLPRINLQVLINQFHSTVFNRVVCEVFVVAECGGRDYCSRSLSLRENQKLSVACCCSKTREVEGDNFQKVVDLRITHFHLAENNINVFTWGMYLKFIYSSKVQIQGTGLFILLHHYIQRQIFFFFTPLHLSYSFSYYHTFQITISHTLPVRIFLIN